MGDTFVFIRAIVVILFASAIVSLLFRSLGQPQVVGEMLAGILLGPSLLGAVAPASFAQLFPPATLGHLTALSEFGLIVYMLVIGSSIDTGMFKVNRHAIVLISHTSVVLPFVLGATLSLYLYPRLADDSVSFVGFSLFMGVAMSITALPVLARILTERNLLETHLGASAITCAVVDDCTGWCVLAAVLTVVSRRAAMPVWATIAGTAAFVTLMTLVARRFLARALRRPAASGVGQDRIVTLAVCLALASALVTDWLGIHPLFGAFLCGAILPRSSLAELASRLRSFAESLLLPIFFALTGLRMSVHLLEGGEMWFYCGLVVLLAVSGKLLGCAIAGRVSGMGWADSVSIGVLMNTRGLMELVVLNIGFDLGIISPPLFAIMVIMALATTAMAAPLLAATEAVRAWRRSDVPSSPSGSRAWRAS
jgi:Kef-type K+ transport system membrane component KefB